MQGCGLKRLEFVLFTGKGYKLAPSMIRRHQPSEYQSLTLLGLLQFDDVSSFCYG